MRVPLSSAIEPLPVVCKVMAPAEVPPEIVPALVSAPLIVVRVMVPEPEPACEIEPELVMVPAPSVLSARFPPAAVLVSVAPSPITMLLALAGASANVPEPISWSVPRTLIAVGADELAKSVSVAEPETVTVWALSTCTPAPEACVVDPETVKPDPLLVSVVLPPNSRPFAPAELVEPTTVSAPALLARLLLFEKKVPDPADD